MDNDDLILLAIVGVGAFFFKNALSGQTNTQVANPVPVSSSNAAALNQPVVPAQSVNVNLPQLINEDNGFTETIPALPNNIVEGVNVYNPATGSYTLINYPAVIASDNRQVNSNYTLTDQEADQYIENYWDIEQWIHTFGIATNNQAAYRDKARYHWQHNGVAEKRIFVPLIPKSNAPYIPPPPAPKKSTLTTIESILSPVTSLISTGVNVVKLASAAGINGFPQDMEDETLQTLVCGGYILKNILKFYVNSNLNSVVLIEAKLSSIINDYFG